ncbi:MAG: autotransporter domain-containing protein, partial [Chlorobiales bacterium]|nr:autotransporter domain-containing protein [Chlorobiales bacterium]
TVTSGSNISGATPISAAAVAAGSISTVFDGGTLKAGAANLTMAQDFTVKSTGGTIDQNGLASTFSGDISNAAVNSPGFLNIKNTGSGGSVTLSGMNTCTGTTTVETGAALVGNGLLSSPVIVNTGAALHGLGVINSPITVAGILAPGNSPGTLTTVGTVTMASGSTMSVDVDGLGTGDGAGNYDRLLITGTGNQFVIESGSTLSPVLRGITGSANNTFVPSLGDSFRIVTADGGISGRFDTILQPASGLLDGTRFYAFYNVAGSNSVDLRVIPTSWESYVYLHDGNENAQSAARVLDQLVAADSVSPVSSKQQALLYGAAGANAANLTGMTTALAGEVHGAMAAEVPLSSLALQSMVSDILGESPLCGEDKTTKRGVWFTATKNWDKRYGDDLASSFDADRNQYTVGGDLLLNKNARIGVGYSHVDADVDASHDSSGSATQNMGFVYGQFNLGGAVLESLVSLGSTNWKTSRPDPLGLSPESLDSEENGFDSMAGVTLRVPVTSKGLSVQPYASLVWVHSDRGSIEEDGASPAALSLPGYSMNGTRMMAGVALGSETRNPLAVPSTFHLNFGFGRDSSDLAHPQVDAELADIDMPILTPRVSQTFFQTKAGATMRLMKNGYCYANYAGQFRNGADSHGCEVGVRFEL